MAIENDRAEPGCGRTANRVWQDMDQPPDSHTRTCPGCREARLYLEALSTATSALRSHDLRHPALRPPYSLAKTVLEVACTQARGGIRFQLAGALQGSIDISEAALTCIVRDAALSMGGVRARRCRIEQPAGNGHGLVIHLRTAVAPGLDICKAMALLRLHIRDAVEASVGIVPDTVHLTVEDLYYD